MMLPARTCSPPKIFKPRRCPAESRPLRDDPPAFLCAITASETHLLSTYTQFVTKASPANVTSCCLATSSCLATALCPPVSCPLPPASLCRLSSPRPFATAPQFRRCHRRLPAPRPDASLAAALVCSAFCRRSESR